METQAIPREALDPELLSEAAHSARGRASRYAKELVEEIEYHTPKSSANETQVGGNHYIKYGAIQPWDVFMRWNLNPYCAYLLPYLIRYREKNGIEDLKKARHVLDKWIEEEERIAKELG